MKIVFLEDEVELNAIGVEQLRKLGHTVYPALDISEAREIIDEQWQTLHLIIADHRLPDGRGVDYLLEVKQRYPRIKLAVVSGCLSSQDEETLTMAEIPYFRKPLLYRQVMKQLREHYMVHTHPPIPGGGAGPSVPPTPPTDYSSVSTAKSSNGQGEGMLASSGVETDGPPPRRKGLTSVIFSKLTGKG